ncbi:phospholipase D-like domain-containing protein [Micromonospora matsumotoense]|uniref:phospholipase D-like domain-containing protein n=1 Tax=Micromonospora matsumotoense TaxID=121616 RepID=UPI00340226D1
MTPQLWELTHDNMLDRVGNDPESWILQVPGRWGWSPTDPPAPPGRKTAAAVLLDRIRTTIGAATETVDITGFGVPNMPFSPAEPFPDGRFAEAMTDGLREAAIIAEKNHKRLTVRIMAGVLGPDRTADPWAFRDRMRRSIGDPAKVIDFNVASMTTRGITSYNHTKFVLVDGEVVIHGGINWMTNFYVEDGSFGARGFGGTAPVTDLDIVLRGPAARSAGYFLDQLWTWACKNAAFCPSWTKTTPVWLATNTDKPTEARPTLYNVRMPTTRPGTLDVVAVGSLGFGILDRDPMSASYQPPAATAVEQAEVPDPFRPRPNNETNTNRDFMTVNPDANAMRALLAMAGQTIVLAQQDITGYTRWPLHHPHFDVRLIDTLVARMIAGVKVRIIISNPGEPDYSNINDVEKESLEVLRKRLRLVTDSENDMKRVLHGSLQFATIRVSDQPTWPGGYKYRLHSKIIMVDDIAFYVGSRNVYPDTTQDHGFFIEDATAAAELNRSFLDKLWKYSKPGAIIDWERSGPSRGAAKL